MKSLYDPAVVNEVHGRIAKLRADTARQWGRMNVGQMLAHCTKTMEVALGESAPLPRHPLGRLIGPWVKRSLLVKGKPIGRNARTHPSVLVDGPRNFQNERNQLDDAIDRFARGPSACTRHPHFFFGAMTPDEWATFSYVHLDHHLRQFGV